MNNSCPFTPGNLVEVSTYDWQVGAVIFKARIVRQTSDTHVMIRADDGLFFAVQIIDCMPISSQDKEAA